MASMKNLRTQKCYGTKSEGADSKMIYVLGSVNADLVFNLPYMVKDGETLACESFNVFCGGKGANQAVAIAKLGGKTEFIGSVGSDTYGKMLKDNLIKQGVGTKYLKAVPGSSGLAVILIESGHNRIVLDGGANLSITEADVDNALTSAKAGDILVAQLEIPLGIVAYALKKAKALGMTTVLNPAPAAALEEDTLSLSDILMPNETETEILSGIYPHDVVHTALAVKKLYSLGANNVVITLGARGSAVARGNEITEIAAQKVKAIDTTAAGDTFVGAMCVKLCEGIDLVEACRFASVAASITVQRKGASDSIPTLKEALEVYNKAIN